jgi:hypothetical protein
MSLLYKFNQTLFSLTHVTGRQRMLTPPRHLIPPLVYPEGYICLILKFVFPTGLMRFMSAHYLCYFMYGKVIMKYSYKLFYACNESYQ